MLRKIGIGLGILILLLICAGIGLYLRIRPIIREMEAESQVVGKTLQPRVVAGSGRFQKRIFYNGNELGTISQIDIGWPANREDADLALVGDGGTDFVDFAGHAKKQTRFSIRQYCPVVVARIDSSGNYGYLTRDESWACPVTFFDREGRVTWRSGGASQGVDDSVSGDVGGDGQLSVAVGFNGSSGVSLLDGQGRTQWTKEDANVWHVEMLDINGDRHDKILHSNAKGQLLVRNENGEVIAHYLPDYYVSHFSLARWGDETRPTHIVVPVSRLRQGCCESGLVVLDAKGKPVVELDSPMGNLFTSTNATTVRFGRKGPGYFAVLSSRSQRSMLILYGEDRKAAYQEIIGEACQSLADLPVPDGERLLVGCTGEVWEFSPTPAVAKPATEVD
jgi:hypothetical protein